VTTLESSPPFVFEIVEDGVPLYVDATNDVRIRGSRVLYDLIGHLHNAGDSPESLAENVPTVSLANICGALAYYYNHRDQVDAYVAWRDAEGDKVQAFIESRFPPGDFMERLRERIAEMDAQASDR
jgi:uncharacterized protein (DUF433 family)